MKGLDLIKAKSTSEAEDAYLATQMLPVYEKVRKIKGMLGLRRPYDHKDTNSDIGGKHGIKPRPKFGYAKERHTVFKREVTAFGGVWFDTCSAISDDLESLLKSLKTDLVREIDQVLKRLRTSFDCGCPATELAEPLRNELQARLKVTLEEIGKHVDKKLNPALERLASSFCLLQA